MYRASSLPFIALLLVLFMGTTGCEENTVGPSGSGTLLEAEIDGVKQSLSLNVLVSSYTVNQQAGQFRGSVAGTTSKVLTVLFRTDLDNGTYPRTLEEGDASFILVETTGGNEVTFTSSDLSASSTLTITSKSTSATGSTVIAGTFSATLKGSTDPSLTRTITNGRFSVDLTRN